MDTQYQSTWHPATYVAVGTLQGQRGVACHRDGDRWEFQYADQSGPFPMVRVVDVFRTEIAVHPQPRVTRGHGDGLCAATANCDRCDRIRDDACAWGDDDER
jgi:hypothetical protein